MIDQENGKHRNNVGELSNLEETRYENIFKVYLKDGYYIYNLFNRVNFEEFVDKDFYYLWRVQRPMPWTLLSYKHYDTINLWWLICLFNGIQNPVNFPELGSVLRILRPEHVRTVLDMITVRINEGN